MGTISGIINLNKAAIKAQHKSALKQASTWWKPAESHEVTSENAYLLQHDLHLQKKQPVFKNEISHTNYKIVTDVRIDNRKELEHLLGVEKNLFSNENLILSLYIKYDVDLLQYLIGAFSFVIFDVEQQRIFAARDQMGVKPFHYFFKDDCFVFGTEKTSIIALDFVNKQADWQFLIKHFTGRMSVGDSTEHLNIKVLKPAHFLLMDENHFKQQRYWNLDIKNEIIYKNDEDYVVHFEQLMEKAITCRIADAAHVGSHLSGGLDSGGITGVAKVVCDRFNKPLSTFSYTYDEEIKRNLKHPDKNYDYIDVINKQLEFSNIKQAFKISDPIYRSQYDCVQHEANICGGLAWSNNINTEYEIQAIAQQNNVNVIFSGFPGDELVTSFVRPYYLEYLDKGNWIKFFKSKHKGKYKPHYLAGLGILKLLRNIGFSSTKKLAALYQKHFRSKTLANKLENLETVFAAGFINQNDDLKQALSVQYDTEIHQSIPLSLKEYQRNHILRSWTARRMNGENTAARFFNLEYRYPLADIRLLEFVLAIPVNQKRNETTNRLMFRRGIAKYVHPDQAKVKKEFSSLKPLSKKIDYNNDLSLKKMWNEIKDTEAAQFLNKDYLNEIADKAPQHFATLYNFFLIAELLKTGKMTL